MRGINRLTEYDVKRIKQLHEAKFTNKTIIKHIKEGSDGIELNNKELEEIINGQHDKQYS